jgi:hypothetical protein
MRHADRRTIHSTLYLFTLAFCVKGAYGCKQQISQIAQVVSPFALLRHCTIRRTCSSCLSIRGAIALTLTLCRRQEGHKRIIREDMSLIPDCLGHISKTLTRKPALVCDPEPVAITPKLAQSILTLPP